jgi:hypothetical protein
LGSRPTEKHGYLSVDDGSSIYADLMSKSLGLDTTLTILYQLTIDAYVGTPPQFVPIVIDTSIPYTFLPSPNCTSPGCTGLAQNAFDSTLSSTFRTAGLTGSAQLGDYVATIDGVFGEGANDTVTIGSETFTGRFLYVNNTITPTPLMLMYNGRLGLGYSYTNINATVPSFLPGLLAGLPRVFSVWMGNYVGYEVIGGIEFGGYDGSKVDNSTWTTIPNQGTSSNFWVIYLQDVKIGSIDLGYNGNAIIDLASPLITVPYSVMETIAIVLELDSWGTLEQSAQTRAFYYKIPCANAPYMKSIVFTIAGKDFTFTPAFYLIGDGVNCIATLYGHDLGNPVGTSWVFGNSANRGLMSVFDYDQNTISWARLLPA